MGCNCKSRPKQKLFSGPKPKDTSKIKEEDKSKKNEK